jgi:hypothetical protein
MFRALNQPLGRLRVVYCIAARLTYLIYRPVYAPRTPACARTFRRRGDMLMRENGTRL